METPAEFQVDTRSEGGALIVAPKGEIDMATANRVAEALAGAGPEQRVIVLDLREVTFLDTSGVRLVVAEQRRAQEGSHRFAVVRGPAGVQRIFSISGLDGEPGLMVDDPADALDGS
ncbi:MAG TPA: STAS domain-containing protein [Thermoleophilaceae bacterium]|jgi:anti-sigma B factor antagonist